MEVAKGRRLGAFVVGCCCPCAVAETSAPKIITGGLSAVGLGIKSNMGERVVGFKR